MIASLLLAGLGPHTETRLAFDNPTGAHEIRGASMVGKSTVIDAVCLALWGVGHDGKPFPVEAIADDAEKALVELTTAKGTTFRRTLNRKRGITRAIVRDGEETALRTEEDFRQKLGPLGDRWDLCRVAMVPMSWVSLVQGNARAFRDVLAAVLPAADLRAEVARIMGDAGHEMRKVDPVDPKLAEGVRREANKAADQAAGKAKADHDRVVDLEQPVECGPSVDAYRAALRTVNAADDWAKHDTALRLWEERNRSIADAEARLVDWEARRAELGERPAVDAAAITGAFNRRREAQSTKARAEFGARTAGEKVVKADAASAQAERALVDLAGHGDACPTCGRDGWAAAAEKRATADTAAARARDAVLEAQREAEIANAALAVAEREVEAALEAERQAQESARVQEAWDAKLAALGRKPVAGKAEPRPAAPEATRPDVEQRKAAEAIVEEITRMEGARRQREADLTAARRTAEASTRANRAAAEEAARLDALVDAVRRAPTEIAKRQAEALGELGPVSLRFGESEKDAAVEVLIDGRPWWLASKGRQIVADLWLRLALRRALGMAWLPLFVDETQSWSGEWPELDGPVVFLRTTKAKTVRVVEPGAPFTPEDIHGIPAGERAA